MTSIRPPGVVSAFPEPTTPPEPPTRFNKDELVRRSYELAHRVLEVGERTFHRALGRAASVMPEGPVGGLCGMMASSPLSAETLLFGYAQGMFPMDRRGRIVWNCPDPRCVVPLDRLTCLRACRAI